MALDITARLDRKLPIQSGNSARGSWSKQEFIVETQESYPKKICMSVWGQDKVNELMNYSEGEVLKISFNIESREYNSRWFTDIRAWKIERLQTNAEAPQNVQRQSSPVVPPDDLEPIEGGEDDLPF